MSAAEQLHTEPARVLLMRGSFDTLKEQAGATYDSITFAEIEAMAREPATAEKKRAPCAIFSTYLAHDGRTHKVQAEQGQYIALPGDIDQGNPHIADVDAAIVAVYGNVRRRIYSTASATPVNRKWRFIIELAAPIPGEIYASMQLAAFSLMREQGITCDPALSRPGQVAYLPNVPSDRRDSDGVPLFYDYMAKGSELFAVSGSAVEARMIEMMREAEQAHRQAQEAAQAQREARQRKAHATGSSLPGVIDAYNAQESIDDLLASYGYRRHGRDWQSPNQTSGSYATRVMDGGEAWVSLSESDVAAGLGTPGPNGGCWGDAFDLFKHYEHGGKHEAAMAAAAKSIPLIDGRTLDQARRDEWKAQQGGDGVEIDLDAMRRNSKQGGDNVDDDPKGKKPRFELLPVSHLLEQPEPLRWLITGHLLPDSVNLLFGDPAAGKSLIAIDWAACIATGREWYGNSTARGPVIYIAGEGHFGIRRRLKAWALHHQAEAELRESPLLVSRAGAPFTDPQAVRLVVEAVDALIEAQGKPALLVIDTLHRNMQGDENSAQDIGDFIRGIDSIRLRYGCAVLVVHHSGHGDKGRSRGSSSIKGAVDTEIALEVNGEARTLTCTKMKDGPKFQPQGFDLVEITLPWRDAEGNPETSVVLAHTGNAPKSGTKKPTPPGMVMALESFFEAGHGEPVHVEAWREPFYRQHTGDTADAKKKAFLRVRRELTDMGAMTARDDIYAIGSADPWKDWHGRVLALGLKWSREGTGT